MFLHFILHFIIHCRVRSFAVRILYISCWFDRMDSVLGMYASIHRFKFTQRIFVLFFCL